MSTPPSTLAATVTAIFDRELTEAKSDGAPRGYVDWLTRVRDEVLAALPSDPLACCEHCNHPPAALEHALPCWRCERRRQA